MPEELSLEERLLILRETDTERRWYSVDDKRLCLICEQIISGRGIRIDGGPDNYRLGCPTLGCTGEFSHWLLYRPTPAELESLAPDAAGVIDILPGLNRRGLDQR